MEIFLEVRVKYELADQSWLEKNGLHIEYRRPGNIVRHALYKKDERCVMLGCGTILRETNRANICSPCVARGAKRFDVFYIDSKDKKFAVLVRKLGGRIRKL